MKSSFGFRVSRLGLSMVELLLIVAVVLNVGNTLSAPDLRAKAEAEGKLMFYATFNASDSKATGHPSRSDHAKSQQFQ
jgi:hypothetical protein